MLQPFICRKPLLALWTTSSSPCNGQVFTVASLQHIGILIAAIWTLHENRACGQFDCEKSVKKKALPVVLPSMLRHYIWSVNWQFLYQNQSTYVSEAVRECDMSSAFYVEDIRFSLKKNLQNMYKKMYSLVGYNRI